MFVDELYPLFAVPVPEPVCGVWVSYAAHMREYLLEGADLEERTLQEIIPAHLQGNRATRGNVLDRSGSEGAGRDKTRLAVC